MKKIAFYLADQNPHRDRSLGITTITKTLMGGLAEMSDYALTQIVSQSSFQFEHQKVSRHLLPWRTDGGKASRILTDNLHPLFLAKVQPDIWLYPKGYISYVSKPKGTVVSVMHDTLLQHYADKYPTTRSSLDLAYWLGLMKASIRRSDHILTVTQNAKQQILSFADRYAIPVPQIHVTYEASDFEDLVPGSFDEKEDYVLHLASDQPHKCTLQFLQLWQRLQITEAELPPLHLVGNFTLAVTQLAQSMKGVLLQPRLNQAEFVDAIRRARALVFPSEMEGFGLPAIEAYFLNTPVCYVANTAVAEVLNADVKAGQYEVNDFNSFAQALTEVLNLNSATIAESRTKLLERYSKKRYLAAVNQVLASI
jgi:glycosyltransferase involved in cell wall biosynthesis